jgi:hypothetical protein
MEFPTQPAFVASAKSGWGPELTIHPMMKFVHEHEKLFDAKKFDECEEYHDSTFVYTKSTGQSFTGYTGYRQWVEDYGLFQQHFHEPVCGAVTETEAGYRLFGQAKIFVNLPVPAEKKFEDMQGRKWDCVAQGAIIFDVKKDPSGPFGFKFTSAQVFADPTPILTEAIKRGVIPVDAFIP